MNAEEARKKYKCAEIRDGAVIIECVVISEGAVIGEDAMILDGAVISECVVIHAGAVIGEGAVIGRGAVIGAGAMIGAGAWISKGAEIGKCAEIGEGAVISEGAMIRKGAEVGADRIGVKDSLVILGIGETRKITAYHCDDGLIINIGCANDCRGLPFNEMLARIKEKYTDPNHPYFAAMELIKMWDKFQS